MRTDPQHVSLFSGSGGLDRAVRAVFGGELIAYSEYEPPTKSNPRPTQAAARLLAHHHPGVPNLGDISAIDWSTLVRDMRRRLILAGGFPCQDVSTAGRRAGIRPDTRSGLWSQMAYAIGVLRPDLVVIENVRGLLSADADSDVELCPWCVGIGDGHALRALGAVLGSLADLGYDARWVGLPASAVDAPHGRFRVFVLAWPTADSDGIGPIRPGGARNGWDGPADDDRATTDADGAGWERTAAEPGACGEAAGAPAPVAGIGRRSGVASDADRAGLVEGSGLLGPRGEAVVRNGSSPVAVTWGAYEPAIRRWERVLGRAAPAPTMTGQRGGQKLSPLFVEWMMGLPAGHVTAVPGLTQNEQLKILGNGVVPQQAEAAIRYLLA